MPLLTMTTFAELTKQVHLINDMILSDMICGKKYMKCNHYSPISIYCKNILIIYQQNVTYSTYVLKTYLPV